MIYRDSGAFTRWLTMLRDVPLGRLWMLNFKLTPDRCFCCYLLTFCVSQFRFFVFIKHFLEILAAVFSVSVCETGFNVLWNTLCRVLKCTVLRHEMGFIAHWQSPFRRTGNWSVYWCKDIIWWQTVIYLLPIYFPFSSGQSLLLKNIARMTTNDLTIWCF